MRNQNTFSHVCGDKTVFLWCLNLTRPQAQRSINMQVRNVEKKKCKTAAKPVITVISMKPPDIFI